MGERLFRILTVSLLVLSFCALDQAQAQGKAKKKVRENKTKKESVEPALVIQENIWKRELGFSTFHYFLQRDTNESLLNPGNRVFEVATSELVHEFRPQMKLFYKNLYEIKASGTFTASIEKREFKLPDSKTNGVFGEGDLKEVYVENANKNFLSWRVGLLSYQWGPAEIASPSNGIFHFNRDGRNFGFLEKGKVLADILHNFSEKTSMQLLAEVASDQEPNYIAEVPFRSKGLIKVETTFENSFNYFGLTLGNNERNRTYYGLYGNLVPKEGYSVYLDGRWTKGNLAYKPVKGLGPIVNIEYQDRFSPIYPFFVVGVRYEGDFDLRAEVIQNQEGLSQSEFDLVGQSLSPLQPNFGRNFNRALRSGVELFMQRYVYLSFRKGGFDFAKDLSFSLRVLNSIDNRSSTASIGLESPFGEVSEGYLNYSENFGDETSEFRQLDRSHFSIGLKAVFL